MSDSKADENEDDTIQWTEVKRYRNRLSSKKTRDKERSLIKSLEREKERLHLSNTSLAYHNLHLREAIKAIKTKLKSRQDGAMTSAKPKFQSESQSLTNSLTPQPQSLPVRGTFQGSYSQPVQGNWPQHAGIPNPSIPGAFPWPQAQQVAQIVANSLHAQQTLQQLLPPMPQPQPPPSIYAPSQPNFAAGGGSHHPNQPSLGGHQQHPFAPPPPRPPQGNEQGFINTWQDFQNTPAFDHQTITEAVEEDQRKRARTEDL